MHGSFKAPYPRTACSAYIPDCKELLNLYFDKRSTVVPRYINNTKVNGVDPAPLTSPPGSWPSCASMPATSGQYDGTNNGASPPPWGTWEMYPPTPQNTFEENGTVDLRQCPDGWWKGAAARRTFHGCYGFDTLENNSCINVQVENGDGTACAGYLTERGGPPDKKYLTCKRSAKCTFTHQGKVPDPTNPTGPAITALVTYTLESTYTITVNPISGDREIGGFVYTRTWTAKNTEDDSDITSYYTDPPLGIDGIYDFPNLRNMVDFMAGCGGVFNFSITGSSDQTSLGLGILWYNSVGPSRTKQYVGDAASVAYASAFFIKPSMSSILSVTVTPVSDGTKMEFYGDGGTGVMKFGESTCKVYSSGQLRKLTSDASVYTPWPDDTAYAASGTLEVSIELSDPNFWADVSADIDALLGHYNLTDKLLLLWRKDGGFGTLPLVSRNELRTPISPMDTPPGFDPTTCLVDDLTSPITDGGGNAPFSVGWSPTYNKRSWFDPLTHYWQFAPGQTSATSAALGLFTYVDGKIRGSPSLKDDGSSDLIGGKIAYGRNAWFDFHKENWAQCLVDGVPQSYISGYGNYNPGVFTGVVKQWTNEIEAAIVPPGASAGRYFNSDLIWTPQNYKVKFAVKMPTGLPAQNLFGPAGAMRFDLDELNTWCASGISGSVVSLYNYGTAPGFGSGTLVLLCDTGDPAVDGVYQATVSSTWEITLGARKWDLPTGYTRNFGGSTPSATIGIVRFPDAFPIRGRARVKTATQDGAKVILELGAQTKTAFGVFKYLRDGDLVDCSGISGLGSSLAWERVDDTHGKVTGTLSSPYTSGGLVISHGAPDYTWDTTVPRSTYLLLNWLSEWRSFQERDRAIAQYADCLAGCPDGDCTPVHPASSSQIRPLQGARGLPQSVESFGYTEDCLKFSNCEPQVICISPNGEVWPRGKTHGFAEAAELVPDELFGGPLWQSLPSLAMTEWYWQTPAMPCIDGATYSGGWKADDGTCRSDEANKYYQAPWLVEPMTTLFDGQPALPAGVYLGWLSVTDMNQPVLPGGNITPTPPSGGSQAAFPFDWIGNTKGCIEGNGRFADIYRTYFE